MAKKNKRRDSWIDRCARNAKFDILGYVVEKYHQAIIKHTIDNTEM